MISKINQSPKSIKDIVYQQLKDAVINGQLRPGEQLSEEKLAEQLGVSRTPLREAIQILINDRWFVKEKSRIKVSPLKEKEITNLFLIRERLEALSAYQATMLASASFVNDLQEVLNEMSIAEKNNDAKGVLDRGQQFHYLVIKQSQNETLEEILFHVLDQIKRYRHLGVTSIPGRSKSAVEEHNTILEVIKSGNPEKAEKVMKNHIAASHKSIILSDKYSN